MKNLVIKTPKLILLCWTLLVPFFSVIHAQNPAESCVSKLQKAQELFDNGLVEEIPFLLDSCLHENGFNKEQTIQAYRLLIQVYLFDYKQEDAEKTMMELLSNFPEYELQINDPVEFANLFKQFRTRPVYSFSFNTSINFSQVSLLEQFSTGNLNDLKSTYKPGGLKAGFHFSFEKYFNPRSWVTLGLGYNASGYKVDEKMNFDRELLTFQENMQYIQVPMHLNYILKQYKKFSPYLILGAQAGFLLKSQAELNRVAIDKSIETSGVSAINKEVTSSRNRLNYSVNAGLGVRYKVSTGYLRANFIYSYGLAEHTKNSNRFEDAENLYYYNFIDDRIRLNYFSFSIGYSYIFYKTSKKPE